MNEQGLAQAGTPSMDGGQRQMTPQEMVVQVKKMLMQGIAPEEILSQGVPKEIVIQAITELQQELAAQQQSQPVAEEPVTQDGLAAQGTM